MDCPSSFPTNPPSCSEAAGTLCLWYVHAGMPSRPASSSLMLDKTDTGNPPTVQSGVTTEENAVYPTPTDYAVGVTIGEGPGNTATFNNRVDVSD